LFPTALVRQIMYQSTDIHGKPIPVTGALLVPRNPSQGPRLLIALMPGTRGLGKHCAPSRFSIPLPRIHTRSRAKSSPTTTT
ncbi:MAG: hypothetical protein LC721_05500, partial [Actinobacteria bacterium]|nr:hypothetical protein [Actinomycetota bacterium]